MHPPTDERIHEFTSTCSDHEWVVCRGPLQGFFAQPTLVGVGVFLDTHNKQGRPSSSG